MTDGGDGDGHPRRPRVGHRSRPGARRPRPAFGDAEALVDGDVRLTLRRAGRGGRSTPGGRSSPPGSSRATAWPSGRPTSGSGSSPLLGLQSAGGVVVPINTRYKGAEAAYILDRSRARLLVTVNGFLGNDYVAMLEGHDLPHLEHTVVLRGDAPAGTSRWADFLAGGDGVDARPRSTRGWRRSRADDTSDILFTSGTTGNPKGVGVHPRPGAARLRRLGGRRRPPARRPLPRDQPVLPRLRLQGRDRRLRSRPAPRSYPQAVFDIPMAMANVAEHQHHDAPRAAGDLPDVPQPPRPRPVEACSRCGSPSPAPRPCRSS